MNDLDVAMLAPFSTCWLPCRRHHRNRTCLLEALPQSASLERTICVAFDCLQLQTRIVPNPFSLVLIPKSLFLFALQCAVISICPCAKVRCEYSGLLSRLVILASFLSFFFFFLLSGKLALTVDKPKPIENERQSHLGKKKPQSFQNEEWINLKSCCPFPLCYPPSFI